MEILDEPDKKNNKKNTYDKGNYKINNTNTNSSNEINSTDNNDDYSDKSNTENSQYSYYDYNNNTNDNKTNNFNNDNTLTHGRDSLKTLDNNNDVDINNTKIIKQKIDIKMQRFPYCLVWTPLPLISWVIPIIGHTGICGLIFYYLYFIIDY
jgi:hypothetical protein